MTDHRPFLTHPHLRASALPDCGDALLIDPPELDAAVIGMHPGPAGPVFVYDAERLVELLAVDMEPDDLGEDDDPDDPENTAEGRAWLHLQSDILRWLPQQGPRAPLILQRIDDEHPLVEGDSPMDYAGAAWTALTDQC